jgi:hypothetical protein
VHFAFVIQNSKPRHVTIATLPVTLDAVISAGYSKSRSNIVARRLTLKSSKRPDKVVTLRMERDDLDNYIAKFSNLANKAGYGLNDEATLALFERGLPAPLLSNAVKFHHPNTWDEWVNAVRVQHQEYFHLKSILGGSERRMGGTRDQWRNALKHAKDPNAMDIGRTRARATLTDADKAKLQKEGRCFRCQQQGHISRNCPKKPLTQPARAAVADTIQPTASISTPPPATPTPDDESDAILAHLMTRSEETRTQLADKLFGKKDFPNA